MANERVLSHKQKIQIRRMAWRRLLFDPDGNLTRDGRIVLGDLRRFCRASASTAVVSPVTRQIDPLAMAMAEGRREVFNRIAAYLHINEKQIFSFNEEDGL